MPAPYPAREGGETSVRCPAPLRGLRRGRADGEDIEVKIERLTKEEEKLKKELARSEGMLSNEKFVSRAPEAKIAEEREKLEKYRQMMAQVQERLAQLRK